MNPATSFPRTNRLPWALALAAAATWSVAAPSPADAINITIYLNDKGMNPPYDSNGSRLKTIADAAAIYWEETLPESGTYDVDLWWDDGLDGTTLGSWTWDSVGKNNIRINPNPHGNPLLWYIDPTPTDHGEFDFVTQDRTWNSDTNRWDYRGGQWLYRDMSSGDQTAWFDGNPPLLMEIGYRGRATDPTIQNQLDLFSTVIHELGHEMGVNSSGGPWEADPAWLAGGTATFKEDDGHLHARTALMAGAAGMRGTRRFPSAVDIMAVADDEGMTTIDLPRQDFVTGNNWNSGANWLGGTVPDIWDGAYIRHGGPVSLTANAGAQTLLISAASELSTSTHKLEVPGRAEVVSSGPVPSEIHVEGGGWVMLKDLTLDGGILDMNGGLAELVGTTVTTSNTWFAGEISGHGEVGVSGWLINNGIIKSTSSELKFHTYFQSAYSFDLDGTGAEDGVVESHSILRFDGRIADAFHGTMKIGAGNIIRMKHDWTLGLGGLLELNGDIAAPATLVGPYAATTIKGLIMVDRLGMLATQRTVFEATALVSVADGDDRLVLDAPTVFKGGDYVGNGALEQQCEVQVWEDTTIDAHEYDWGNSTGDDPHDTYVNETVTFKINSATTGTPDNEYRGTIHVIGGTLAVNLDTGWLLPAPGTLWDEPAGILMLDPGDVLGPRVIGVPLRVEGSVYANGGNAFIEADFITSPSAEVTAVLGAELLLKGHNTYDGGTITGDGEIGQWGDTEVVSGTTIGTQYYDLDGNEYGTSSTTILPGVMLTINSQRIDEPGGSFDGTVNIHGGTLAINTPSSWTIGPSGALDLSNDAGPAVVAGSPIVVDGQITTSGGNEIHSIVTFGNSAAVAAPLIGDILRLRGLTNYEGGSYTGTGGIIQDATAFVNAPTTIDLGFFDMDGIAENSLVELHADLTLNVENLDMNDNCFHGILEVTDPAKFTANTSTAWSMAGTMNVVGAPGTQLTVAGAEVVLKTDVYIDEDNILEFEANVSGPGKFTGDGLVSFLGKYSPGNSPTIVTADGDVSFGDSALLVIEIGGTVPGRQYDTVQVDGEVALGGQLTVELLEEFMPEIGNTFTIMSFGQREGKFDIYDGLYVDAGVTLVPVYGATELILQAAIPGDANGDGCVTDADAAILVANWQACGMGWSKGDFNGNGCVTDADAAILATHWQEGVTEAAGVPEPSTPIALLSMAVVGLLACVSRRRLCIPKTTR